MLIYSSVSKSSIMAFLVFVHAQFFSLCWQRWINNLAIKREHGGRFVWKSKTVYSVRCDPWSFVDGARAKIDRAFTHTLQTNCLLLLCVCPMPKYLHFSTGIARSDRINHYTRDSTLCKYLVVFQWFIFGHVIYRQALDLQKNTGGLLLWWRRLRIGWFWSKWDLLCGSYCILLTTFMSSRIPSRNGSRLSSFQAQGFICCASYLQS